jgi:hypothetical protein
MEGRIGGNAMTNRVMVSLSILLVWLIVVQYGTSSHKTIKSAIETPGKANFTAAKSLSRVGRITGVAAFPADLIPALTTTPVRAAVSPTSSPQPIHKRVKLLDQIGGITKVVAVQGHYVYLGVGPRLVILDTSNPSQPTVVGQTDVLPGDYWVQGIVIKGNIAYVAKAEILYIFNLANPAQPEQIDSYNMVASIRSLTLVENVLYVVGVGGSLGLFDVSDSTHPTKKTIDLRAWFIDDVAIVGNVAYVTADGEGLRIIDLTNPTELGFFPLQGKNFDIAVRGNIVYVTNGQGFHIFDVSNPTTIQELTFFNLPDWANGIILAGNRAYIFTTDGIHILNIANPAQPNEIGGYQVEGGVTDIALMGYSVYLAKFYGGLQLVDTTNPATPLDIGRYTPLHSGEYVDAVGDMVYVTDVEKLYIFALSHQTTLTQLGVYTSTSGTRRFTVSGNMAYILDDKSLHLVDISNPAAPIEVGSYIAPKDVEAVAVEGHIAYLAATSSGLRLIDVSTPAAPKEISSYLPPGEDVWYIAVAAGRAYLATKGGMHIVDVSNSAVPREVTFYKDLGRVEDIWIANNNIVYVTSNGEDNIEKLHILDVSEPTTPKLIKTLDLPDGATDATDLAVTQNSLYLTTRGRGLYIYDITHPANPLQIGSYSKLQEANSIAINGNVVYVANGTNGLAALSIEDDK